VINAKQNMCRTLVDILMVITKPV